MIHLIILQNSCSRDCCKVYWKIHVTPNYRFFLMNSMLTNFPKKSAQLFSFEFCKILKTSFKHYYTLQLFLKLFNTYRKTPVSSLFCNKVAGLRPATFLKKRLQHRCFPVNIAKFLRAPISRISANGYLYILFIIFTPFFVSLSNLVGLKKFLSTCFISFYKLARLLIILYLSNIYFKVTAFAILHRCFHIFNVAVTQNSVKQKI